MAAQTSPAVAQATPTPARPSWASRLTGPPPVKEPYKPADALDDLDGVSWALETFLNSQMFECEEYCHASDVKKERLYFATGYGLIQCVKGLMSYEDEDLLAGIQHTKQGNHVAQQHRKKAPRLTSRLAGYVVSSFNTSGVGWIKSMTPVERHAELTYAESLFEKTILGIVYSGDWLALVTEILNMRTLFNIYRQLGKYIDVVDAEGQGDTIDAHFRSGVYLGVGLSHLILSLMPGKILSIVELFGYHGDRQYGLEILQKAGGWSKEAGEKEKGSQTEPGIDAAHEGVRRTICDMALLIFHLVMSSITFDGIDIGMAQRILDWNLRRYPNGVFFLFGAGRLALIHSQPRKAIEFYTRAMEAQKQYRNLHHISHWEMAISNLALWDLEASRKCWEVLEAEATWSKSIYSYGLAVCLLESAESMDEKEAAARRERAATLMAKVPSVRQRIAGKSIPLEKLVARKARKFQTQGHLALPALELAYLFLGIAHAPREILTGRMLPEVWALLARLGVTRAGEDMSKARDDHAKEYGKAYWDDFVLARFLEGVCLRYVAYPDPDAIIDVDAEQEHGIDVPDAADKARAAFADVFKYGPEVVLDHHLVYHAHYELGRLLACLGDTDEARRQFDLVLSGKYLEVNAAGRKGRYSMEKALMMRTHAAMEALHNKRL
ncbi:hypothetical protein BD626DRAFT_396622 [Schizophyllum amplum]|uniref:Tetratricopeptide repeat protein 39B n=1 Tax=Schizophyllum amplum TaxID=97359 RepID=A0A550CQ52_9AGAR|nr:hypothetical protein BD626DRAFT_396622 [Auriculariopsis ampla]